MLSKFAKAVISILKESQYPCQGKAVAIALLSFADDNGYCFPSQRKIAKRAGLNKKTARKWLRHFKKEGKLEFQKGSRFYKYRVHFTPIGVNQPPIEGKTDPTNYTSITKPINLEKKKKIEKPLRVYDDEPFDEVEASVRKARERYDELYSQ